MANLKFHIGISIATSLSLGACVTPSSLQTRVTQKVENGDRFTLLPSGQSSPATFARDGAVLANLQGKFPGSDTGKSWLIEYSYALRPVDMAISVADPTGEQPVGLPDPDYLLDCPRFTYRLTLRIMSSDNGQEAFRGTAEEQACAGNDAANSVFQRLLTTAISDPSL